MYLIQGQGIAKGGRDAPEAHMLLGLNTFSIHPRDKEQDDQ